MDRHGKDNLEAAPAGIPHAAGAGASPESSGGEQDWGDDWVHELIAMTRPGVEIEFPMREINEREVPFVYDDFR